MKTNKINVVLSLNKTVVSMFDNGNDSITRVSTAACTGATGAGKVTKNTTGGGGGGGGGDNGGGGLTTTTECGMFLSKLLGGPRC